MSPKHLYKTLRKTKLLNFELLLGLRTSFFKNQMQLQSVSIFIKFVYPCLAFCICCLPSSYRAFNILNGYVNVPLNFVAALNV